MEDLVRQFVNEPAMARLDELLGRIVASTALHARFLNMLARMEYVGVRKMLKARRAEHLDLDGLRHVIDEAGHALRLKKAALALAGQAQGRPDTPPGDVGTFADAHALGGSAGEDYFQALDGAAETILADVADERRDEVNYLLTSAAIELRAQAFYPLYERRLRDAGSPVSVTAILRDEDRHLSEMAAALARALPDWRARLGAVLQAETALFEVLVGALAAAVAMESVKPRAPGPSPASPAATGPDPAAADSVGATKSAFGSGPSLS